jgi:hypothetical protein
MVIPPKFGSQRGAGSRSQTPIAKIGAASERIPTMIDESAAFAGIIEINIQRTIVATG